MANIKDYLAWRGDLTFKQSPFNDVDNLLLSVLAYVDLKDIVPSYMENRSITLEMAAKEFFDLNDEDELLKDKSFMKEIPFLMKNIAESERFKNAKLSKYIDVIDNETQMQFSAFHIKLDDLSTYITFRGTDDTLVGWKEDFNMSFISPVPSQIAAVKYVNSTVTKNMHNIRLGGHSKGGNLAIYSAVKCDSHVKKKILAVYNNDGPGFDSNMVDSQEYADMLPYIKTIVPYHSLVGMLLEHRENYMVVKSSNAGVMQHDAVSWQVLGSRFETMENVSRASHLLKEALSGWINGLDMEKRKEFVEILFSIITASGAGKLSELRMDRVASASVAFKQYAAMDKETKAMLRKVLRSLSGEFDRIIKQKNQNTALSDDKMKVTQK